MSHPHLHQQEREFCPIQELLDWLDTMCGRIEFDTYNDERGCRVSLRDYAVSATASDFMSAALAVRRIIDDGGSRRSPGEDKS